MMVMWSNLPKEAMEDCFRPPEQACQVQCLHCGQQYSSADIVWFEGQDGGFWRCPTEGCDGAGFQFDIHPIDSTLWSDDESDEYGEEGEYDEACSFGSDGEDFTDAFEDDETPF